MTLNENKVLVIDVEASAANPQWAELLEIGIVELCLKTGKITTLVDEIIKPKEKISKNCWIFQNSTLSYENIMKSGKDIKSISKKVQQYFETYRCTAYNQQYDFTILRKLGFKIPHTTNDLMYFATDILQIPGYYDAYKWPKVQECIDFLDLDIIEPHRACDDAKIEAQLVYEFIKQHNFRL